MNERRPKTTCPGCGSTIIDCRRYRLEPLADYLRMSFNAACTQARIAGTTQKAAACHGVTRRVVDRIAGDLKEHPATIWPEVVDHDIEDTQVECEAPGCTSRFAPTRKGHRFCSPRCNMRNARANEKVARRERYRTDPEWRERRLSESGAYWRANAKARRVKEAARRKTNGDHIRARTRRWYQANRDVVLAKRRERSAQKKAEAA